MAQGLSGMLHDSLPALSCALGLYHRPALASDDGMLAYSKLWGRFSRLSCSEHSAHTGGRSLTCTC